MSRQKLVQHFKSIGANKKAKAKSPVALHSMLLALEPRMVFDASIPVAAEAIDHEPVQPAMQAEGADHGAPSAAPSSTSSVAPDHSQSQTNQNTEQSQTTIDPVNADAEIEKRDLGSKPAAYGANMSLFGGMGTFGVNVPPSFSVDGPTTILEDERFSLENVSVIDLNANDQLTFSLTSFRTEGTFELKEGETAVSGVNIIGNKITFTGLTMAEINAALPKYNFYLGDNRNSTDGKGAVTIIYSVKDPLSPLATEGMFDLTVTSVNDAPVLTVKTGGGLNELPSTLREGVTTSLKGISVTDVDNDDLRLTISATGGKFNIGNLPGLGIHGRDTAELVLTGKYTNINNLLKTLTYVSSTPGTIDFTFSVEDKNGPGMEDYNEPITADPVSIKVNDPPTLDIAAKYTGVVEENSSLVTEADKKLFFKDITVKDPNSGDLLELVLELNDPTDIGKLYSNYTPSSSWQISGDGKTLTITGESAAVVQAILDNTYFMGATNKFGDLKFSATVTDKLDASASLTNKIISVTPVNDPAVVNLPTDHNQWARVFENGAKLHPDKKGNVTLTLANFGITDIDTPLNNIMITIASLPLKGSLICKDNTLGAGASFSLKDVSDGIVKYYFGGDGITDILPTGEMDSFNFTVDDGSGKVKDASNVEAARPPLLLILFSTRLMTILVSQPTTAAARLTLTASIT